MKNVISRLIIGFCIGLTIGVFGSLISSYLNGSDVYYASMPVFYERFSNHLEATTVALLLYGLLGSLSSVFGFIYDIKSIKALWAKTIIHALCLYTAFIIVMYVVNILNYSSLILCSILWVVIYAIIWIVIWITSKRDVDSINKKLKAKK